jgi:mono/diheme cytochrome c family protein
MKRVHSGKHVRGCGRLLIVLAVSAAGCDLPGRPDPADRPVPANEVVKFSVLYGENCAGCHGANGTLGPAPPLNDPLFRAIISEEELEKVLTEGREKALMPAFAEENGGPLTAAQIQVLVKEINGIRYNVVERHDGRKAVVEDVNGKEPKWGSPGQPPKGVPSYLVRAGESSGNKERGATLFARACADCHGEHGQGVQKGGETVRAIHDPVFLALVSDQVLRRYVITGRPDLEMPNFSQARPADPQFKPLTDQDVTDLVALVASWRQDHATRAKP